VDAVDLLDRHPDVGVASGQPVADVEAGLLRPEKVYLTAYLMDIFPDGTRELEPVGFAEGCCDAFRMKALREVGFYQTTVRRAGEDLVMAARLRRAGYRVCRAPGLRYYLSVSSQQDSVLKLVRHARVLAQVTPYIFFGNRGTLAGVVGASAGPNRQRRALLRVLQISGGIVWLGLLLALATWQPTVLIVLAAVLVVLNGVKLVLFRRHIAYLRFGVRDLAALAAVQPGLDVSYLVGVVQGTWQFLRPGERKIA
jgi:cellulose synthase/poly-beta-1,6-N-acetylglucosamine synthase-like glycosyltransferase